MLYSFIPTFMCNIRLRTINVLKINIKNFLCAHKIHTYGDILHVSMMHQLSTYFAYIYQKIMKCRAVEGNGD